MADVRSSEPGGAAVGAGSRAPRAAPRLRLGAHRCSRPAAPSPARKVATTLRTTFPPRVAAALAHPEPGAGETESGRRRHAAPPRSSPGPGPARARGGGCPEGIPGASRGPRPRPRSLFRAVQQDPGEAALAAAHGDQQRAVDDLLHPHGQPAAGPRLHAPRPGPAPAPRRVSPARDAARRPPDVTKLRSGRPPRAGRGRREGRAGHPRPQTRAGPCGLHTRRGDALRSPTERSGWGRMEQGRAPPPATLAASARGEDLRAGAWRTAPAPGPRTPSSPAGGPPGAPAPPGSRVSSPLLAPAPPPALPVSPGSPPPGLAPGWPPGHCGEEVPAARAGSPAGSGRGDAGRRGDTGGPAAAAQSRPRRLGGALDDPLGALDDPPVCSAPRWVTRGHALGSGLPAAGLGRVISPQV